MLALSSCLAKQVSVETHDTQTADVPKYQHMCTELATLEKPSERLQRASADIEGPPHIWLPPHLPLLTNSKAGLLTEEETTHNTTLCSAHQQLLVSGSG